MLLILITLAFALCASAEKKFQLFATFERFNLSDSVDVARLVQNDDGTPQEIPYEAIESGNFEIQLSSGFGGSISNDFQLDFACSNENDTFTFDRNEEFVACCDQDQNLEGSEDTSFACCDPGQYIAGGDDVGFQCCGLGEIFNGEVCKETDTKPTNSDPCPKNEVREGDKCVCEAGLTRSKKDATCINTQPPRPKPTCPPGVKSGKCYTFTFDGGNQFGYNSVVNFYTATPEHIGQQFGKFQLCMVWDSECSESYGDIDPGNGFRIREFHGSSRDDNPQPDTQWLNSAGEVDATSGQPIARTSEMAGAGTFVITKWPGGKHCLGAVGNGLQLIYAMGMPSASFTPKDSQSCIPLNVLEVPCDIRSPKNNCIWNATSECPPPAGSSVTLNASIPNDGTGEARWDSRGYVKRK